jgi:carboxylesterase
MANKKVIIRWFYIPWLIFAIIFTAVLLMNKKPPYKLDKYPDLSNVEINELIAIDHKRALSEGVVKDKNFPLYKAGNSKVGVLLIHGFTASPYEMSELSDFLNQKGYSVYNARVVGHGSKSEYLDKLSYRDWYDSLKYGYFTLKNSCEKVYVIGQSMGGLLALNLAYYNNVDGVILLAPAFKIIDDRFPFVMIAQYFLDDIQKEYSDTTNLKDYYYDKRSVKGMVNLKYLIDYTLEHRGLFKKPLLIFHSKYDDVVDYRSSVKFYNEYNGEKEFVLIDDSKVKHILSSSLNYKNLELYKKILNWLEEHNAKR